MQQTSLRGRTLQRKCLAQSHYYHECKVKFKKMVAGKQKETTNRNLLASCTSKMLKKIQDWGDQQPFMQNMHGGRRNTAAYALGVQQCGHTGRSCLRRQHHFRQTVGIRDNLVGCSKTIDEYFVIFAL